MKIRTGFVSNSSSSSFVVIGVKLTHEELEKMHGEDFTDALYAQGLECIYAEDCDAPLGGDEGIYVGKEIMHGDSDSGGLDRGGIFSIPELLDIAKSLEKYGKDIRLIGGMRAS